MNDYDKAGRYLIKRDAARIIGWILNQPLGVNFHAWLDSRRLALPDQRDLTHDLVAACGVGQGFEGFCIELVAKSHHESLQRVAYGYMARLLRERSGLALTAVGGVVVNFTGPARAAFDVQAPTLAADCRIETRIIQRTLRNESAQDLVESVLTNKSSIWLLGWLPLMQGGSERGIVESWRSAVTRLPDPRDRGVLAGLTLTFATLARNRPFWERGLEGFNVIKSPYLEELREAVRLDGIELGRAEGSTNAYQEMILELGQQRFSRVATKKQRAELEAITDVSRLKRIHERLLTATSWADLLATV